MARIAVNRLPVFGRTAPGGAFTWEPYGNTLFFITEIGEGGTEVKALNTNERSIWTIPGDTEVSPAEHVMVWAVTDDGAGFITT
jgi:hypothetical protein